ncbi:MAG: serine/threonine-protein kinase [Candidatus Eremiobacterota bacterium]
MKRDTIPGAERTRSLPQQAPAGDESKYRLESSLGEGGMGSVFRIRDQDLDREVAAKALRPELAEDPAFVARFVEEARITGRLQHPNIVPVHDLGISDGIPYFTMMLVRGETLRQVIERLVEGDRETHRVFDWARRVAVLLQICDAVSYAHSRGVLHLDLKPENVMLGTYGEVQVMDWGLARNQAEASEGTTQGTPVYSAPEQMKGDALDQRTDVYGLAALAYELLSLRPPYEGDDLGQVIQQVLERDPQPVECYVHAYQGRVPRELSLVLERALKRDPEQRFPTVLDMRQQLHDYLAGQSPVVCVHTGFKRWVHRLLRLVDRHGKWVIVATLFWLLFPWFLLMALWLSAY